ncbi:hypothetical protein [Microtetraspora malaysiensis]|uniref:hypothetical protein n=1 Tax=Microtetraspora malaysiensis TaxID=161358 RepID=UPI000830D028|nr:hypothetical protein [Microtetraspora malaysiensis]
MKDPFDGAAIDRPAVTRGLSEWSTMAGDLERDLPGLVARILELNATEPWGGGSEGASFRNSYYQNGGPNALITKGRAVVKKIGEAGPRLRTTFDNTHGVDEAHAQDMAQIMAENTGQSAASKAGRGTAQDSVRQV